MRSVALQLRSRPTFVECMLGVCYDAPKRLHRMHPDGRRCTMTESEAALSAVQVNEHCPSEHTWTQTQLASTSPAATIVVSGADMSTPSGVTLPSKITNSPGLSGIHARRAREQAVGLFKFKSNYSQNALCLRGARSRCRWLRCASFASGPSTVPNVPQAPSCMRRRNWPAAESL